MVADDAARASTGNGTPLQIGAVSALQSVYLVGHFLSSSTIPGDGSLTMRLQSSADGSTGWTNRAVAAGQTAAGTVTANLAGPITDTWWRGNWSIAGTAPSFRFVQVAIIA
jgi:hypothetical protein